MSLQLPELEGKVCLVTGGTSGLGKALATELARQGATVVISGRASPKANEALEEIRKASGGTVEFMGADLLSNDSIRQLARDFKAKHPRLDVLVNNAGGVFPKRMDSKDGIEATFALNVVAPFVLTQELRDQLKASGGRVINLATRIPPGTKVKLDDVQGISGGYSGMSAYGRAKLVLIMLTREMAKRLQPDGITANSVHPGIILETNFSNNMGLPPLMQKIGNLVGKLISVSLEQGIASQLYLAGSPEAKGVTGKYFMKMKPAKEPSSALDDATCQGVYAAVEKLSGASQGGARAKTGS